MNWDPTQQVNPDQPTQQSGQTPSDYGSGSGAQYPSSGYGNPQDQYMEAPPPPPPPPMGNPYDPYGNPQGGFGMGQPGFVGYGGAAPATPLPLSQAIQELPSQWWKVLTKPSADTFAQEAGKAEWGVIAVVLAGYAIISGLLGYLRLQLFPLTTTASSSGVDLSGLQTALALFSGLGALIAVPISFFIGQGIYFGLAKAFGGQGSFTAQSYSTLLFQIPLGLASLLLAFIPVLGGLIGAAAGIYEIVLSVFMLMGVHRLSGGKATAVVLIPVGAVVLLLCIGIILLIAISAAAIRSTQ